VHPVLFQIGSFVVPSYGVLAALGVLLALGLAQITAKRAGIDPGHAWNMIVLAIFAALAVSRFLLIAINFSALKQHPRWLFAVGMVHHPLLGLAAAAAGAATVLIYVRWSHLPLAKVADCLAAPISLGIAAEQLGALLAGSDYGSVTSVAWAVTYNSPVAMRWSGTPPGIPLHPLQAYAAIGSLLIAAFTYAWLSRSRRDGDVAGVWLVATGAWLFLTEIFRDWEGRGVLPGGIADAPQLVGLGLVLFGGLVLADRKQKTPRTS
jgi:phosphatidylglycerol:prolipoprotein diacylglycerol transferase